MNQPGPSSSRLGKEVVYVSFNDMPSEEQTNLIDSLHDALEGFVSKKDCEDMLESTGGNVDLAYSFLSEGLSEAASQLKKKKAADPSSPENIREYDEVLKSITDLRDQRDFDEIIGHCPSESPRHILNMYRHFHGNKNDTVAALLDGYVIPAEKSGMAKKVKSEDTEKDKGKGKEAANGKAIKPGPSGSFSNNPCSNPPCRDTSSDSEDHPHNTPTSSSNRSSSPRGLPMRRATSASWSFGDLPPLPDSPSTTRIKTDNEGYDVEDSDIEMLLVKSKIEEDEDIYGLPVEDNGASLGKAADPGSFSSSDEDENVDMSPPKDSSSSGSDSEHEDDSDDDDDDNEVGDSSDIDMSGEVTGESKSKKHQVTDLTRRDNSKDEEAIQLTTEEKEAHLFSLFPHAGISNVKTELQLNEGDIVKAAADLEELYGLGGSSDPERSVSPRVGSSRPKKLENLKRSAGSLVEGRQTKRSRWIEDSNAEEVENTYYDSAEKWVLNFLHVDTGVQIELDSGIHPCRVPENALRKIPGFRAWLDSNPLKSSVDCIMKVPDVSLETFNLGMQWAICSIGRFTINQRRTKTNELTALIDLAAFAATVSLPLGGKTESFMSILKAILVKHRNALTGSHIRRAFENLRAGHQVRKLLIQASLKPYVEFYYAGEDINKSASSSSDSEDDSNLNPAQLAAYRKSRFCFHKEFNTLEDYQNELLKEFHRVWWARSTTDFKYSRRHFCHITTLTDPLTEEQFNV